ncbi:MAG: hypothetical protein LCH99_24285, partial [Proteobacteria bacterium]|nr:hypothetical protein [Pseudomonadota bacterium]
ATIAGRDIKIVRGWIEQYGIGRQVAPGARIDVSRIALEMLLHGDHDALEKLREGDRVSGEVARYFSFSGIQE